MTALLAPIGRVLFATIFILALPTHLKHHAVGVAAAAGVPYARIAVPIAMVIASLGGLMVALGYRARLGAALIVVFLVPVTLYMHRFWGLSDPLLAHMQMAHFIKNVSLLGAALFFIHAGAGAYSFDARAGRGGELHAPA